MISEGQLSREQMFKVPRLTSAFSTEGTYDYPFKIINVPTFISYVIVSLSIEETLSKMDQSQVNPLSIVSRELPQLIFSVGNYLGIPASRQEFLD